MSTLDHITRDTDPADRYDVANALLAEVRRRVKQAADHDAELKHCPRCDEDKPRSEFGVHASRPDGLQTYCRTCR